MRSLADFFCHGGMGTHSPQDSIMLREFASPHWRDQYLEPLVQGEIFPSFGMTEPDVASSDPTQLQTTAILDNGTWKINGKNGLPLEPPELPTPQ